MRDDRCQGPLLKVVIQMVVGTVTVIVGVKGRHSRPLAAGIRLQVVSTGCGDSSMLGVYSNGGRGGHDGWCNQNLCIWWSRRGLEWCRAQGEHPQI